MGLYLKELIEIKSAYLITLVFGIIFLCLSLQDIAVDGWSVTIVKEENLSYSSSAQTIGLSAGVFLSTTIYFALNSVDFCNKFIRPMYTSPDDLSDISKGPYSLPLLDETSFMKGWGIITILISIYTLILHDEKEDRVQPEVENSSIMDIFKLTVRLIYNKNMLYFMLFLCSYKLFSSFSITSSIYLLDEKMYPQMNYSILTGIIFPFEILISSYCSKWIYQNPFKVIYYIQIGGVFMNIIYINIFLANYDAIHQYSQGSIDILSILLFILLLFSTLIGTITFSGLIAIMSKSCDKNNGGTHITILASFSNAIGTIPILYSYRIIDSYGMFIPTFIGSVLTFILLIAVKPVVDYLEKSKREDWSPQGKDQKYEKVL
mmetsp:Transcript_683/g.795  ORF Transcript_683/g.795 Transcript_683/m.795 type:complete len:376 (+) Transcript_683:313-1440(+)